MITAFLYAGQGSQRPGMGADFYEVYPEFRKAYDEAKLSFDIKEISFRDESGLINQTKYTQPCMVAFAAGVTALLHKKGIVPDYACGLSLGEYSALNAAGVLTGPRAVELVAFRGEAMTKASEGIEAGMSAVLGLEAEPLKECCKKAESFGVVSVCNYNCPGQIVIGGEKAAVEKAGEFAKEAGAKRIMPLNVSGPFHTSLMAPAGEALAERFKEESFGSMNVPVLFNCLGDVKDADDSIADLLVRQVQSPVYMEKTIKKLYDLGVETFIEIGPGKALSGFIKKTLGRDAEVAIVNIETIEDYLAI